MSSAFNSLDLLSLDRLPTHSQFCAQRKQQGPGFQQVPKGLSLSPCFLGAWCAGQPQPTSDTQRLPPGLCHPPTQKFLERHRQDTRHLHAQMPSCVWEKRHTTRETLEHGDKPRPGSWCDDRVMGSYHTLLSTCEAAW